MDKTRLAFHAKINGLNVRPAKETSSQGRFELGLVIDQPLPPKPPPVPWEFAGGPDRSVWKPRPERQAEPDAEEADEATIPPELDRMQKRYDAARADYEEAFAAYQDQLAAYRLRVRAYAELVGIAAVFGNQFVSVIITPANQDILPGFAAELPNPLTEAALELSPVGEE